MSLFSEWRKGRRTEAELFVLGAMDDGDWHHVYGDLTKRTGLRSGRLYPTIHGLEERGEVEAKWDDSEDPPPKHRRRMYRLAERDTETET